jgi:Tfp pilus assembly protein PilO
MKTKNIAVGALVAVLTMALWYNFLLKPSRSDAKKVKAETETEKTKLAPLQAQLAQANNDAAHASTFKAQLAALKHALPESPDLANFIRDANGIAAASGIDWQSVSHSVPTPGADGIATITLGIQVKGTYEQVLDYLTRMAALKRLVVIDGVQFNGAGAGAGAGAPAGPGASTGPFSGASQLSVTIAARMFATPPELAPATADTAATADAGTLNNS